MVRRWPRQGVLHMMPVLRRRPAGSELGQFGGWCQDALHVGAEVDEQGDSLFDTGDRTEAVLVVGDLVVYREAFAGGSGPGAGNGLVARWRRGPAE